MLKIKVLFLILIANFQLSASMTSQPKVAEYGTWESPITADMIAKGSLKIADMKVEKEFTYWSEVRPQNRGFSTIVRMDDKGNLRDMTPLEFNVKTSVHEYGGGSFTVSNGVIFAANARDGKVYEIAADTAPRHITSGKIRFADFHYTSQGLLAIGESHENEKNVENFLALIDLKTGDFKKLTSGHDFYSSPTLSPDGKKLVWLSWDHPNMPWTHTELWMAEFTNSFELQNPTQIAGVGIESIFQPEWGPDGALYFVSDRESGWWNLYRYQEGRIENVCPIQAEVGVPQWVFGVSTYAFLGDKIAFGFNSNGLWHLAILDPKEKKYKEIPIQGNLIREVRKTKNGVQFVKGYSDQNESIVELNTQLKHKILYQTKNEIDKKFISLPEHIVFPSEMRTAYGFFYPPKNANYKGPSSEKPPLVVMIHGGPTAQTNGSFQLSRQFWTSRGFAVLDVNYGGSTGYGRKYRELLNKNWGIVDVEDCVNGAKYLAGKGLVDKDKLVIRGGSAGGYTTLAALAFHDVFKAGASYYGIADITALAEDTHKFESRYMELLVGSYPEEKQIWEERSPIHSVDKIKSPLVLFQGENDKVVPKNQSIMIYNALKARSIPVEIYIYPDEEHGFRQSEHIIHSLQRELDFYKEVFRVI